MSLELTPDGTEAYRILRWAQENPADRKSDAQRQVNDLARPLLGDTTQAQALAEVQDAGTMLSRLAAMAGAQGKCIRCGVHDDHLPPSRVCFDCQDKEAPLLGGAEYVKLSNVNF